MSRPALVVFLLLGACREESSKVALPTACDEGKLWDGSDCVAEACGDSAWGWLSDMAGVVYVQPGAAGTGTSEAPFGSIAEALESDPGSTLALGAGIYTEAVSLGADNDGVQLLGRCPELVVVDGTILDDDGDPGIRIDMGAGQAWLGGITVRGAPQAGLAVASGTVRGQDLVLSDNRSAGLWASGSEVDVDLSFVRIVDTLPVGAEGGTGLYARDRAGVVLRDSKITGSTGYGAQVVGSTSLQLTDVTVSATGELADGGPGAGVYVANRGALLGERLEVLDSVGYGILVADGNNSAVLDEVRIDTVDPTATGVGGPGLRVDGGGTITATGLEVVRSTSEGITSVSSRVQPTLGLSDVWVHEVRPLGDGTFGVGVWAENTVMTLDDSLIEDNSRIGTLVLDDAVATMSNTTIRTTAPDDEGLGYGVQVQNATATLDGVTLEENTTFGLVCSSSAMVVILGSTIRDTRQRATGSGAGVFASSGCTVDMDDTVLTGNHSAGVMAGEAAVDLDGVTITDTSIWEQDGSAYGIHLSSGAQATVSNTTVSGCTALGIALMNEGTHVDLTNVTVTGTAASPDDPRTGFGIQVDDASGLTATDCTLSDNTAVGLLVADTDAEVTWTGGTIESTRATSDGTLGYGVYVERATLVLDGGFLVQDSAHIGVLATDQGTVVLEDGTVASSKGNDVSQWAVGIASDYWGVVDASRVEVRDNSGPALVAQLYGGLTCTECLLSDNRFAQAAAVRWGELSLVESTLGRAVPGWSGEAFGVFADGSGGEVLLSVERTLVEGQGRAGLYLEGAGSYAVLDSTIEGDPLADTASTVRPLGNGLFASGVDSTGALGLSISSTEFRNSATEAILLDDSTATLCDTTWTDNGEDLRQEVCASEPGAITTCGVDPPGLVCPHGEYDRNSHLFSFDLYLPEFDEVR